MEKINHTAGNFNMKINLKKTKVMEISKNEANDLDIQVRGTRLEQVQRFRYLGTIIQANGGIDEENKVRLAIGRLALEKRKELLNKGLDAKVNNRIINSYIQLHTHARHRHSKNSPRRKE